MVVLVDLRDVSVDMRTAATVELRDHLASRGMRQTHVAFVQLSASRKVGTWE